MSVTVLSAENLVVTLLPELGARLLSLRAFGVELLRTPGDIREHEREPFFWGGYHMAPWCNRIEPAAIVDGQRVSLASNFSDGTAIHGQVYASPWEMTANGTLSIAAGGTDWPWAYEVTLRPSVEGSTLSMSYALTNHSDTPMPGGIGFHPWFRQPDYVRIPASHVFPDNLDTTSSPALVEGSRDLRQGGPLPEDVDSTWANLDSSGVEVRWSADGISMMMTTDRSEAVLVAANPSAVPAAAIELQTHAPQGLRRLLKGEPYGMTLIEPGDSLNVEIRMAFMSNFFEDRRDPGPNSRSHRDQILA